MGIVAGAGRCEGLIYRLERAAFEAALPDLWAREMYSGVYRPRWLEVECEAGAAPALAFVIDPGHAQYAGEMALEAKARLIAHAHGRFGPCRDYLVKTARALSEHGIDDTEVATLDALGAADAHERSPSTRPPPRRGEGEDAGTAGAPSPPWGEGWGEGSAARAPQFSK